MFNGLIREIAEVKSFDSNILTLKAKFRPNIGDSVACNGACLSVVRLFDDGFSVELSAETRSIIATKNLKGKIHIEPSMRLGDRIDGHLVQGHIDGLGVISKIQKNENGTDFYIKMPSNLLPFIANKGSIAVDGVSLTINEIKGDLMRLTLIPISMKDTLFGSYEVGREVNIETDLLARYAARIIGFTKKAQNSPTWDEIDSIMARF